jgi:hypothetical protein
MNQELYSDEPQRGVSMTDTKIDSLLQEFKAALNLMAVTDFGDMCNAARSYEGDPTRFGYLETGESHGSPVRWFLQSTLATYALDLKEETSVRGPRIPADADPDCSKAYSKRWKFVEAAEPGTCARRLFFLTDNRISRSWNSSQ